MFIVRTAFVGILAIATIWYAIGFGVNRAVDRVIVREAIDKAQGWGIHLAERVPDLEDLLTIGTLTADQNEIINAIPTDGGIFRLKFFNSEGRLSLVSDGVNLAAPKGFSDRVDTISKEVAGTGIPNVSVFDGIDSPSLPDRYAEAYIRVTSEDGAVHGVVKVYVDQTAASAYFMDSFRSFGIVLMAICAALLSLPTSAFCLQRVLAQRSRQDADFFSRYDPLTGLLNRREFVTQAERWIARGGMSAVCYLDVDRFKSINDTYGHAIGDAFLAHTSEILRKHCRSNDLPARLGGDEFVVAFQNTSIENVGNRVRSILKECAQEIEIQGINLRSTVSIGLVEVGRGSDLDVALRNADAALYHAKSSGRNDVSVYRHEMGEELRRRHALETRLREATQSFDFEIHYQPLVDGAECKIIGHEALLRLYDTDGTPIPPSSFIPLAEELGFIDEIGRWTIRTAMREIAANNDSSMLAINLSTTQFLSGDLVNTVRDAMRESGMSADRLELEITESLLLEDSHHIELQIDTLKEMGVAIAMDDFGTGFSSLSYLWKYGFDRLKIDRSFVAALEENPERSREIIETVVLLGARLGMNITAEGVETVEQSELLRELGCDVLQGYLFGKAAPLEQLQSVIDVPSAVSSSHQSVKAS